MGDRDRDTAVATDAMSHFWRLGRTPSMLHRVTRDVETEWAAHHRRVFGVAYRMLGSVAEAEDVAQDAYERLLRADLGHVDDVGGWLVTVAARRCIDRLRSHDHSRREYPGPWLPEPILASREDLADRVTLDESVRLALLVVLERLTPAERTSFVLHDVFGMSFDQVAEVVGRTPAACRQLASRARRRIESSDQGRFVVDRAEHAAVAERFASACRSGDLEALIAVLDPDVVGDFDSGGALHGAPLGELHGASGVAAQLERSLLAAGAEFVVDEVNGQPGVVASVGGAVVAVIFFEVAADRVTTLRGVGNPAKLAHLNTR